MKVLRFEFSILEGLSRPQGSILSLFKIPELNAMFFSESLDIWDRVLLDPKDNRLIVQFLTNPDPNYTNNNDLSKSTKLRSKEEIFSLKISKKSRKF